MSTKVFVGNLAFKTTDQNLIDLFGQVGQVKSAAIITRGRRSLGYGFVEMETSEQANSAVGKFNNTSLAERTIKVEVAKEPSERPERPPRTERPPKPRAPKHEDGDSTGEAGNGDAPAKRRRRRPPRGDGNDQSGDDATKSDRPPRQPRPPRPERPKIASDTTLFVANLPFATDDQGLLAIFSVLKPKSAHVVRTRNNRSRGYGFVEFSSKADQQAALSKNGATVEGTNGPRQITVTVSTSVPPPATTTPQ